MLLSLASHRLLAPFEELFKSSRLFQSANRRPTLILINIDRPMNDQVVKGIKIDPTSALKEPVLRPLYTSDELNTSQPGMYSVCVVCQKGLRNQLQVCADSSVYCVGCFAKVLPECSWYTINKEEKSFITCDKWPMSFQLLLLEALERFRFGNWKDIQAEMEYYGAKYSVEELESHYMTFYGKEESWEPMLLPAACPIKKPDERKRPEYGGKVIPMDIGEMEIPQGEMEENSLNFGCFNPKRQEFITEYNEDLEKYVFDMEFKDDDTPDKIEIKMQLLQAYNKKLQDRYEKYDFILEHRLLDQEFQDAKRKQLEANRYRAKAEEMIKPLMRFCNRKQFDELRGSVECCLKIQAMINGMKKVRASNLNSTLESIAKINHIVGDGKLDEGQPRKRVHRSDISKRDQNQPVLKSLGLSKGELRELIAKGKISKQPFAFKGISVRRFEKLGG